MEARKLAYLKAIGIPTWTERATSAALPAEKEVLSEVNQLAQSHPEDEKIASQWARLRQQVASCEACVLHQSRTQTVFGVGNTRARVVIIGEAPGQEEDRRGEPFVGRAGKLLDKMLAAVGFSREEVFIMNILKCRPPQNRDPRPEEMSACSGYLNAQLTLLQPKLLLAVGRIAAHHLLSCDTVLRRLRGKWHRHSSGLPLLVTYHPAYLLRNPRDKPKSYEDLLMVLTQLQKP